MFGAYMGWSVATALVGVIIYANLPTRLTFAANLWKGQPALVMAVRRPGCLLCREEAAALSALKSELDKAGVRLYGVVHETHGVNEFKPYLQGDVFYDVERRFYGPKERWLPVWMGFLRIGTFLNVYRAKQKGFKGNLEGEGRLLGGVYLIKNDQIVWAHLEEEWGDAADTNEVLEAIRKLK